MFGNVWFLKRYHRNNQCLVTICKIYRDTEFLIPKDHSVETYLLVTLEICCTLKYRSEKITIFPQLYAKGQGQGHRNKKLAKNVLFFSYFRYFDHNLL